MKQLFGALSVVILAIGGLSCSPTSPTPQAVAWTATYNWAVTQVNWAGAPGTAKSRFDGRCSADSDYIVTATLEGQSDPGGHVTGTTSHCTQITWSAQGPAAVTYSDGRGTLSSATGTIVLHYADGITGLDSQTGETWFEDVVTVDSGAGAFAGATGTAREGGRFRDFGALLAGAPVPMSLKGTLTYGR